jgi:hypothetical protein
MVGKRLTRNWVNESNWLASANPHHLLQVLEGLGIQSGRQFRLAAAAFCRRAWVQLTEGQRRAVELAESFADGRAKFEAMRAAARDCLPVKGGSVGAARAAAEVTHREPLLAATGALYHLLGASWGGPKLLSHPGGGFWIDPAQWQRECGVLCGLLRDIFANPFRPLPAIEPAWLEWHGGTVPKMASAIYEGSRFEELPILADALEEAGCADAAILAHCRQPGDHARGCWLVDLLIGKG